MSEDSVGCQGGKRIKRDESPGSRGKHLACFKDVLHYVKKVVFI